VMLRQVHAFIPDHAGKLLHADYPWPRRPRFLCRHYIGVPDGLEASRGRQKFAVRRMDIAGSREPLDRAGNVPAAGRR
jgi:hypothetical protein